MSALILWFRRDLRLNDNTALHAASTRNLPIIPLFIFDPDLLKTARIGVPRLKFLLDSLISLDASLQAYNTRLILRFGKPLEVLSALIAETGATALYANRDYSPFARARDAKISNLSLEVQFFDDAVLIPPDNLLKDDGKPYVVYTPYWKKWKTLPKTSVLATNLNNTSFYQAPLATQAIPSLSDLGYPEISPLIKATETYAQTLLETFIRQDSHAYSTKREFLPILPYAENRPSGTSYLSPFLRLGLLSPRQVYWAARIAYQQTINPEHQESIEKWVSELAWREFYAQILYHFPHVLERDFVPTYANLAWHNAPLDFQAWQAGQTGFPIIDAPMRQLNTIGWMPNRARMIVASFLIKDLLIHWRQGDIYFMQHLLDGDVASNNGGWQWAAGTGTDAQPYFRIFNPVSQSQKFATPDYLRYWIPELANVPDKYIHEPHTMPTPPRTYAKPIIDHAFARERTLAAFKAARGE